MIGYEKFTDSIDEPAEPEPNKPSEDPPLDYQVNYDKIEVSIEDNSNNSNSNEVLQRASLYDNFLPSWSSDGLLGFAAGSAGSSIESVNFSYRIIISVITSGLFWMKLLAASRLL